MASERLFSPTLVVFLFIVGATLLLALADRSGPDSVADIVVQLGHGDHEGCERRQLLERMLVGQNDDGPMIRLCRTMAAVALDDEAAYRRLQAAAGDLPIGPEHVAELDNLSMVRAALGDPVLAALLAAMLAEVRGDSDVAERYAQVQASSRLFHMDLAGRLAQAGASRVR